jgi:hypothetical protein
MTSHPNECPQCSAFRTDGQPPTVHRTGCTRGSDPSHTEILRYGTHHQTVEPVQPGEHPKRQRKLNLSNLQGRHWSRRP